MGRRSYTLHMPVLITVILCDVIFVVLAVPLMLRKVGPNVIYGYRTRATMSDKSLWYEANAHFGRGLFISSAISGVAALVIWMMKPPDSLIPLFVVILVVPALIATIATSLYIRRLRA